MAANRAGEARPFLPQPYSWKNDAAMNHEFWQTHQTTPYDQAETLQRESHAQIMAQIEGFTHDELFMKKHYGWTGTTNLGSYVISAKSSHYEWAMKMIKRYERIMKSLSN